MRFLVIILWASVLIISNIADIEAQGDNQSPIQIPILIRAEQGLENIQERFLTEYRERLAEENITLFERDRDVYILIDFRNYYEDQTKKVYIDISVSNSPLQEISTILSGGGTVRLDLESEILEQNIELASQVAASLTFYSTGKCGRANVLFNELLKRDIVKQASGNSNIVALHFLKGNCAILQQNFETAIALFQQALSLSTSDSPLIGIKENLAWTYLQVGQKNKGLKIMDSLVQQFEFLKLGGGLPVYIASLVAHAEIYAIASEHDTALSDMDEAIELASRNPELYTVRGQIYLNQYEWDKSLADYNTALELAPDYAEAYFQRGLLYYSILQTGQELREEALADFQHYLELAPDGSHAAEAQRYIETIEAAMAALND